MKIRDRHQAMLVGVAAVTGGMAAFFLSLLMRGPTDENESYSDSALHATSTQEGCLQGRMDDPLSSEENRRGVEPFVSPSAPSEYPHGDPDGGRCGQHQEDSLRLDGKHQPAGIDLAKLLGSDTELFGPYLQKIDWKTLGRMMWESAISSHAIQNAKATFGDPETVRAWSNLVETISSMRSDLGVANLVRAVGWIQILMISYYYHSSGSPLDASQIQRVADRYRRHLECNLRTARTDHISQVRLDDIASAQRTLGSFLAELPTFLSADQARSFHWSVQIGGGPDMGGWSIVDKTPVVGESPDEIPSEISRIWIRWFDIGNHPTNDIYRVAVEYVRSLAMIEKRYASRGRKESGPIRMQYDADRTAAQSEAHQALLLKLHLTSDQEDSIRECEKVLDVFVR